MKMMLLVLILALTIISLVSSYKLSSISSLSSSLRKSKTILYDDGPSDIESSNNDIIDITITNSDPKAVLLGSGSISILSDAYSRTNINENILALEKMNPTENPAMSQKLNGVWEVVVAGFGSPGIIGIQAIKSLPIDVLSVDDVTLKISSIQPRVEATTTLKVGSLKVDVSVSTDLTATSGSRLKEKFASGKIGTLELPKSSVDFLEREMIVTYVDDDVMIVRDSFGSPEVLKRKNEFKSSINEGVPSVTGDVDGAPGV